MFFHGDFSESDILNMALSLVRIKAEEARTHEITTPFGISPPLQQIERCAMQQGVVSHSTA
jgi:hypothetical protein